MERGADDDGSFVRARVTLEPNARGAGLHLHPTLEERFEGVAGTAALRIGKEVRKLAPGDQAVAPPGTPHAFSNTGSVPAVFTGEIRPASDEFLSFMAKLDSLTRAGQTKADGRTGLLQGAVLFDEYLDVVALPAVPLAIQRFVFGLLAPLGRLRGYRAEPPAPEGA